MPGLESYRIIDSIGVCNIPEQTGMMVKQDYSVGPLVGKGCLTSIMVMQPGLDPEKVPSMIERDRVVMAACTGMQMKLLPVLPDMETGETLTGGVYLFDTIENARDYYHWCRKDFFIEGVQFEQMPGLKSRTSKVWRVIGAEQFKDIDGHHVVMRHEEWRCPKAMNRKALADDWGDLKDEAKRAGLASVWLLCNEATGEIGLVTTGDRAGQPSTDHPDEASLRALAESPSLARRYQSQGARPLFDRSSFVYTVWFPVTGGASDRAPLWPNSPPLPGPQTTGD